MMNARALGNFNSLIVRAWTRDKQFFRNVDKLLTRIKDGLIGVGR